MIIVAPWLLPGKTIAFTFYPFIFVRDKNLSAETMNHERIHLAQQLEMMISGVVISALLFLKIRIDIYWYLLFSISFFYLWYYIEYLIRACMLKSFSEAYYRISFEMEAYSNEKNHLYLKTRIVWAFLKWY